MPEDFSVPEAPGGDAQSNLSKAESTELDGLRSEMADSQGKNFDGDWSRHYWNSEKKQARAQEMLAREAGEPDGASEPAGQAMTDGDVPSFFDGLSTMGSVGADFAQELARGDAQNAVQTIASVSNDILDGMGASGADVSAAFDGLPSNVQASVYREFASAYVPPQPAADAADLATFAESGTGQILTQEWGESAGRNLATALFRWDRMVENLSDRDVAAVDDFYLNRLQPNERTSILRRLAA